SMRKRSARSWRGDFASANAREIDATDNKRTDEIRRFMIDVRCRACRTASAIHMEPVRPRAGDRYSLSSARSISDKQSQVADDCRRATKIQSRQSALVCQLEEPALRFQGRNCARRASGKSDRRLRPMRKPKVESVSRSETASLL